MIEGEEIEVAQIMALFEENMRELQTIKDLLSEYLINVRHYKTGRWIGGKEVQKYLKISKCTLRRYRQQGLLKFIDINNTYRYYLDDIIKKELLNSLK